jgi:hypothetical protein
VRSFVRQHVWLVLAGAVGLALFLSLYDRSLGRGTRPQPLDRDEVQKRAVDFAALEGWGENPAFAYTVPIEGDDAAATDAGAITRAALPDPLWETAIVTGLSAFDPSVRPEERTSAVLSLALTPAGEVVQYLEVSAPFASDSKPETVENRAQFPLPEFDLRGLFDARRGPQLQETLGEREQAVAAVRAFFERHGLEAEGAPAQFALTEGPSKARVAYLTWSRPGPGGTNDTARVILLEDRVVAFDRDLEPAAGGQRARTADQGVSGVLVTVLGFLLFLVIVAAVVGIPVLAISKRRKGEINLKGTAAAFALFVAVGTLTSAMTGGMVLATLVPLAGHEAFTSQALGPIAATFLLMPYIQFILGMFAVGGWAVGESTAYIVWPRRPVQLLSELMRGRFRTRDLAEPVAVGYLLGFAALGLLAAAALVTPAPSSPSVAPLMAFYARPVVLPLVLGALQSALLFTLFAGMFVMTYTRRLTRRTWVAVIAGAALATPSGVAALPYFTGPVKVAAAAALMAGAGVVFARLGPVPCLTSLFALICVLRAYPLALSNNASHAASGAVALALGLVPAGIAALGWWLPKAERLEHTLPDTVRRALEHHRIGEEFEVARRLQASILPTCAPDVEGLDVAGTCVPANEVGGDYFDYFPLAPATLAVAVGDVSGKGAGAALYMTLTTSYMDAQASDMLDPVRALAIANTHLRRNLARGTFVTMVFAVVDAGTRRFTYARAGHNPPLLARSNGDTDYLTTPGIALGSAGPATFEKISRAGTVDLRAGDLLLLYTDGVTEAMDVAGGEYGEERLARFAAAAARSGATAAETVEALLKDVRAFAARTPQHDDITVVAVRVL